MTDYSELRRLAEAAAAIGRIGSVKDCQTLNAFTRAATSKSVLALIAENERIDGCCKAMAVDMGKLTRERNSFRSSAEKLKAENELLELNRTKLAGELSRLRGKHKDWSVDVTARQGEQP